jgi:hypothetical protein
LRQQIDAGTRIGPRVIAAGFIDGPGPYEGPIKVLAATPEEARQRVDHYADLGYVQIKIYSSVNESTGPAAVNLQALSATFSEAAAIRKISVRLLPIIALGYGISYIDRANIGFAALQMNRDLHFSATIYGLGAGLFFLGYAACELPSNWTMR